MVKFCKSACGEVNADSLASSPEVHHHLYYSTNMDRVGEQLGERTGVKANVGDADALDRLAGNDWSRLQATGDEICRNCKIMPICSDGGPFKPVHDDQQAEEAATLPCISLNFNLERLFLVARAAGVMTADIWDPEPSPTAIGGDLKRGRAHYLESMREEVLEKA